MYIYIDVLDVYIYTYIYIVYIENLEELMMYVHVVYLKSIPLAVLSCLASYLFPTFASTKKGATFRKRASHLNVQHNFLGGESFRMVCCCLFDGNLSKHLP